MKIGKTSKFIKIDLYMGSPTYNYVIIGIRTRPPQNNLVPGTTLFRSFLLQGKNDVSRSPFKSLTFAVLLRPDLKPNDSRRIWTNKNQIYSPIFFLTVFFTIFLFLSFIENYWWRGCMLTCMIFTLPSARRPPENLYEKGWLKIRDVKNLDGIKLWISGISNHPGEPRLNWSKIQDHPTGSIPDLWVGPFSWTSMFKSLNFHLSRYSCIITPQNLENLLNLAIVKSCLMTSDISELNDQ